MDKAINDLAVEDMTHQYAITKTPTYKQFLTLYLHAWLWFQKILIANAFYSFPAEAPDSVTWICKHGDGLGVDDLETLFLPWTTGTANAFVGHEIFDFTLIVNKLN